MTEILSPMDTSMFVKRLHNLPLVSYATSKANDIVDKSRILRYTADTACSAVRIIATPIASSLPVQYVDKYANEKLADLEKSVPLIAITPTELIGQSKAYYSTSYVRPAIERVGSAARYGRDTVSSIKRYGNQKIDNMVSIPRRGLERGQRLIKVALNTTDLYVDQYLPNDNFKLSDKYLTNDKSQNVNDRVEADEDQSLKQHLFVISDKVRTRTTSRVVAHVCGPAYDILEKVHVTNMLINMSLHQISATIAANDNYTAILQSLFNSTMLSVNQSTMKMNFDERLGQLVSCLNAAYGQVYAACSLNRDALLPLLPSTAQLHVMRGFVLQLLFQLRNNSQLYNNIPREVIDHAHTSLSLFHARIQYTIDNILDCRVARLLLTDYDVGALRIIEPSKVTGTISYDESESEDEPEPSSVCRSGRAAGVKVASDTSGRQHHEAAPSDDDDDDSPSPRPPMVRRMSFISYCD